MNYLKVYQQGDLLLKQISKKEFIENTKNKNYKTTNNKLLKVNLAFGEVTGHSHRLELTEETQFDVKAFFNQYSNTDNTQKAPEYIEVIKPTELRHEEHGTIMIQPGYYNIQGVREFDYIARTTRNVID